MRKLVSEATSWAGEARAFVSEHRAVAGDQVWGIGDLVSEFGITARAIRLYEEKGLLTPQRLGTQRVFTRRDRARLSLILRAKSLGSTLEEIKQYLDLYGQHGEGRKQQLEFVVKRTTQMMAELREKRVQIDQTLAELQLICDGSQELLQQRKR
jgi:DNA-binding transcriptional MerR regulator